LSHGTGWLPDRAAPALAELLATRRYATVAPGARATRPVHVAPRFRWMFQGGAGTCYTHGAVAHAENLSLAKGYPAYKISRRLVAWVATDVIGPGGNPSDGGSITDALRAMTEPLGAGIAHEALCPYTDDYDTLGRKPDPAAFADARANHLTLPVPLRSKAEIRPLVDADHCVGIGIPWSQLWDSPTTFQERMGPIDANIGHALLVCGYADAGILHREAVWRVDNWHGRGLYPALPPALAAAVPGYATWQPGSDSSTWFTDSLLDAILALGGCELVSASDLTGAAASVLVPSADGLFPI
jgi:hypothetical protein